jgi:hypothetical protein
MPAGFLAGTPDTPRGGSAAGVDEGDDLRESRPVAVGGVGEFA